MGKIEKILRFGLNLKRLRFLYLLLIFFSPAFMSFSQVIYVVNSTEDFDDVDLADKICADMFGNCTIRAAIQNANKTKFKDKIIFDLSGIGPFEFNLKKNLPRIISPVEIDATTQEGFSLHFPQIILLGDQVKSDIYFNYNPDTWANGLQLLKGSSGSLVKGLSLVGFLGYGIRILNSHQNHIVSNLIGIRSENYQNNKGNVYGIGIAGNSNVVVGFNFLERNIISDNEAGIYVKGERNEIIGNFIGTDSEGETSVGNNFQGIQFHLISGFNLVMNNLISGNRTGIHFGGKKTNFIYSNKIGTNFRGDGAIPNKFGIVLVNNFQIQIGDKEKGNLISGNEIGIHLLSSPLPEFNNNIKGNYIGVDGKGEKAIPNEIGIVVECSGNIIGDIEGKGGNLISGNSKAGILIKDGSLNIVQGNFIGTDKDGKYAIPNGDGIVIMSTKNEVALTDNIISNNLISGNKANGIRIGKDVGNTVIEKNQLGYQFQSQLPLQNGLLGVLIESKLNNCIID